MRFIGEGANKKVYQLDEAKVIKVFNSAVNINDLKNIRLIAERNFGNYLPELYGFTHNGIIEEYCGKTIGSSHLNIKNRMDAIAFFVRTKLRHQPVDHCPENFAVLNGKLKYIDWDSVPSESSLFGEFISLMYFASYGAIKILEHDSFFRKIQRFYRANILPTIRQLESK